MLISDQNVETNIEIIIRSNNQNYQINKNSTKQKENLNYDKQHSFTSNQF